MTRPSNLPSYRRPLNTHQITILNTLYKFRFTTATLLAENQQANHTRVISNRLKILVEQEYLGMNYDSSYKLRGKPATYFLKPKAVRFLRAQSYTNESALRSIYHDKRASEERIQHRLNVFIVFIALKHAFPGRFKFFSKTELTTKPYVPKVSPDAYLVDNISNALYFMDYLEDNLSTWELRKVIKRYINFLELEEWQVHKPDQPHPDIIFVCESETLKKRVDRMVSREMDSTFVSISMKVATISDISSGAFWAVSSLAQDDSDN